MFEVYLSNESLKILKKLDRKNEMKRHIRGYVADIHFYHNTRLNEGLIP